MNISRNIRRLTNIFLVLFVALSAGLVYWQVVVAKQVTSNAYLTYTRQCTSESAPQRGRIYDRNGVLLAYSVKSDIAGLCGYKRIYTPDAQGMEGLLGYYISPLFSTSGVEGEFNDFLNGKNGVTGLDNTVNNILHVPPQGDDIYLTIDSRIEKILVQNFNTEATINNTDTFKTDRGSVIVSDPRTGEILGILSRPGYDANCVVNCSLDLLRQDMLAKGYDKIIGCAAPCGLDQFKSALDNQRTALIQKLGPGCDQHSDCTLGSDCEQNNQCNGLYLRYLNSDPERPLIFRPTQDCYPPGSTYKTMTLMAALDSGAFPLSDQLFYNDPEANPYPKHLQAIGPITVGSNGDTVTYPNTISNITGYTFRFPVSLAYGFSHSDNIIFAEAGVETDVRKGTGTWLKYNDALYLGQNIPFDLPVKVSTVTPQKNLCSNSPQANTPLSVPTLASDSFGQGTDFVTPFQIMVVNNVAADDGKLMRPSLIQKIVDPKNASILQQFSPTLLSQVVSATTAQEVRDAMYGVVSCGSGSLTKVQLSYPFTPWGVIGKTGTAQVNQDVPGTLLAGDSWFMTAAPYVYQSNQIPRITITAMKENGGEGAYANGPMLRDIYSQIFSTVLTDTPKPTPPSNNFCVNTGFLQTH
ncbi:MAG: penicillin-binding transpeptidase domain-containing protein [Ktedonobacteraceae bacterium]